MCWRTSVARGATLLVSAFHLSACAAGRQPDPPPTGFAGRPSIVFIYTDDQAPWAMSAAREAHPDVRTPNLDRLVREGAYLPNAFTVTPVCSPSRAEFLTSRYGSEVGITEWINPRVEPELGLDPATVTWPEVLQSAGYATGLVGKWHLGEQAEFHPTRTGYDSFVGFLGGGTVLVDPPLEAGGVVQEVEGFTTEILTDSALSFIRRHQAEPFVLSLHYRAPHAPWLPLPEEDWAAFRNLDPAVPDPDYPGLDLERLERMTREYLGSVASVDRNVGRVLQTLDELGLAENTIVIFTSDHGYNMGHHGIWHKGNGHWVLTDPPPATENVPRGQRPNMFDHSLRVPAVVRWPAEIPAGSEVVHTLTNLDWYPTLLEMAGVRRPENVLLRGRSFLPLLRGEEIRGWDDDLYGEYSTRHQSRTHMRMYRTPEWKLVRDFLDPSRDELYHLAIDPAETTNLIRSADPEARRAETRLHAAILAGMREIGDPLLKAGEIRK